MTDELFNKALNYYQLGEYKEALVIYYEILAKNIEDYRSYYNVALMYDLMGEEEFACAYYNKAIKLNTNDIRSMNNLAKICLKYNQEEGCKILNKIIEIEPMDAEAYNTYGNLYFDKKDYKNAKYYFKKSIDFDKDYFKNYYDIAKAYIGLNEFEKAKEMLGICIKLKPDFDLANELLSKL